MNLRLKLECSFKILWELLWCYWYQLGETSDFFLRAEKQEAERLKQELKDLWND